jgi:hypothetical protein
VPRRRCATARYIRWGWVGWRPREDESSSVIIELVVRAQVAGRNALDPAFSGTGEHAGSSGRERAHRLGICPPMASAARSTAG